jgi:uncharacterized membrane protein YdjX (TVP38/TMEM64 family)
MFETLQSRLALTALLALVCLGTGLAFWFGLDAAAGVQLLRTHQAQLLALVAGDRVLAALIFMGVFALAVATAVPGLAVLTMAGGLLFGWVHGTILTMIATSLASAGMFLLARSALGEPLRAKAGPALQQFAEGFRESALTYVFVLNLVPIFPYVMVITIPAACGVSLGAFMVGAFFGILPATILFAYVGSGLGNVLMQNRPLALDQIMTPEITASLAALAALALLPVLLRNRLPLGKPTS